MAGAYCRFCDHRCFVDRVLPDRSWSGHMATCPKGMDHDRRVTGYGHTTAINPLNPTPVPSPTSDGQAPNGDVTGGAREVAGQ
jgi:hypothetical protein